MTEYSSKMSSPGELLPELTNSLNLETKHQAMAYTNIFQNNSCTLRRSDAPCVGFIVFCWISSTKGRQNTMNWNTLVY